MAKMKIDENILSFEAFASRKQPRYSQPYNLESELSQACAGANPDLSSIDATLLKISNESLTTLGQVEKGEDALLAVRDSAAAVRVVPANKPLKIATVGHQGKGKSLLMNALLHQRKLSKTTAGGRGSTSAPVHYIYAPRLDEDDDVCSVQVICKDFAHIRTTLEGLVAKWYFHNFVATMEDQTAEEDKEQQEEDAVAAEQIFRWLCNADNHFQDDVTLWSKMTYERLYGNKLLDHLLAKAQEMIIKNGFNSGAKPLPVVSSSELATLIDPYVSHSEGKPALWFIVDRVEVSNASCFLKNRISLIDLPGFGDTNVCRTAATNLSRRQADCEIIVAGSDRVLDEREVELQLKQSIRVHGASSTILVLTKIDEFLVDIHALRDFVDTDTSSEVTLLRRYRDDIQHQLDRHDQQNDMNDELDDEPPRIRQMRRYLKYLEGKAQATYIHRRAQQIEHEMVQRCKVWDKKPIHVFSVSSMVYLEWIRKLAVDQQPVLSAVESGIPALRQFLVAQSMERTREDYRNHLVDVVSNLLTKIDCVVAEITAEHHFGAVRKDIARVAKDFKDEKTTSMEGLLKHEMEVSWCKISDSNKEQSQAIETTIRGWCRGVRFPTFLKCLVDNGIPKYKGNKRSNLPRVINWNADLLQVMQPDLNTWENNVIAIIETFVRKVQAQTGNACVATRELLRELPQSQMRSILLNGWEVRAARILDKYDQLSSQMLEAFSRSLRGLLYEENEGCTIAQLNSRIYQEIARANLGQKGRYNVLRDLLVECLARDLDGETFAERYSSHILEEVTKSLSEVHQEFQIHWSRQIKGFDEVFALIAPSAKISEQGKEVRQRLHELKPAISQDLAQMMRLFAEVEVIDELPIRKKRRLD